jgi:hypothetical protein
VTELTARLVAQTISRVLVTTGVIAGGAANSWWTLGGSLVLSVMLGELWNHMTQPVEAVENEIHRELEKMAVAGSATVDSELSNTARERKALWQRTVQGMFQ